MSNHQEPQAVDFDPIEFIDNSAQRPLSELLASLMHARRNFDPSESDYGRAGIYQALLGIIDYITAVIPHRPDLLIPLRELLYGLRSLDDGTTVPLLQAVELDHRPPNGISQDLLRADAAVLMELKVMELRLQKKPKFRDEAANMVAHLLNRLGLRDGGDRIIGKQVAAWRDQMKKGVQKPDFAVKRYFWTLGELRADFRTILRRRSSISSVASSEMHAPTIPKKGVS